MEEKEEEEEEPRKIRNEMGSAGRIIVGRQLDHYANIVPLNSNRCRRSPRFPVGSSVALPLPCIRLISFCGTRWLVERGASFVQINCVSFP